MLASHRSALSRLCQNGIGLADPVEALRAFGQSEAGVGIAECRQFVAKDGADAEAERLGFFGGVGEFGDDAVDDAVCKQFRGPYSLFGSHGRSVAGVVVEDPRTRRHSSFGGGSASARQRSLTDIHEVQVNVHLDRETAHAPRQIRPFGSVLMSVQPSSRWCRRSEGQFPPWKRVSGNALTRHT
jgi:hypothetical protein